MATTGAPALSLFDQLTELVASQLRCKTAEKARNEASEAYEVVKARHSKNPPALDQKARALELKRSDLFREQEAHTLLCLQKAPVLDLINRDLATVRTLREDQVRIQKQHDQLEAQHRKEIARLEGLERKHQEETSRLEEQLRQSEARYQQIHVQVETLQRRTDEHSAAFLPKDRFDDTVEQLRAQSDAFVKFGQDQQQLDRSFLDQYGQMFKDLQAQIERLESQHAAQDKSLQDRFGTEGLRLHLSESMRDMQTQIDHLKEHGDPARTVTTVPTDTPGEAVPVANDITFDDLTEVMTMSAAKLEASEERMKSYIEIVVQNYEEAVGDTIRALDDKVAAIQKTSRPSLTRQSWAEHVTDGVKIDADDNNVDVVERTQAHAGNIDKAISDILLRLSGLGTLVQDLHEKYQAMAARTSLDLRGAPPASAHMPQQNHTHQQVPLHNQQMPMQYRGPAQPDIMVTMEARLRNYVTAEQLQAQSAQLAAQIHSVSRQPGSQQQQQQQTLQQEIVALRGDCTRLNAMLNQIPRDLCGFIGLPPWQPKQSFGLSAWRQSIEQRFVAADAKMNEVKEQHGVLQSSVDVIGTAVSQDTSATNAKVAEVHKTLLQLTTSCSESSELAKGASESSALLHEMFSAVEGRVGQLDSNIAHTTSRAKQFEEQQSLLGTEMQYQINRIRTKSGWRPFAFGRALELLQDDGPAEARTIAGGAESVANGSTSAPGSALGAKRKRSTHRGATSPVKARKTSTMEADCSTAGRQQSTNDDDDEHHDNVHGGSGTAAYGNGDGEQQDELAL